MKKKPCSDFLVASCVPDGGVYRFRLYEDGGIEFQQKISMPSPMYIQLQGNRLWAILRAPFENSKESGVVAYDLTTRTPITKLRTTKGEVACHLAVDGDDVYCANYSSGSVYKTPDRLDVHQGHSKDPVRQTAPHVHSVCFSPDRQFLLSCDLGLDQVFVYDRDLRLFSTANVPTGSGARHLVFSKDGNFVYVINEMGGSISCFSYQCGALEYVNTRSVLPSDFSGVGSGAAIKRSADGSRLYVTERATQIIVTLSADGANLTMLARTDCHGQEPRDFALLADDRFAVCTNQFDDTLSLFRLSPEGIPMYLHSIGIPAPLCAVEISNV